MNSIRAVGLLLLGLSAMVGDLAGIDALKALGLATAAAPAPKVFSAVRGYETYSTRFVLEWREADGERRELELTPQLYAQLRGPYNRRNVFGAALAYGPVLSTEPRSRAMFEAVAGYAMTGDAPLLREIGVDPTRIVGPLRVRYIPRPGTVMGELPTSIEIGP